MNSYIIGFGGQGGGGGNGAQGGCGPQGPQGPGAEGGGKYINANDILLKIGGVLKHSNFQNGITLQELLDKLFFPNIDIPFPENPIFIGLLEQIPNVDNILQLQKPTNFYQFDFNQYIEDGYIIIAMPAMYYLKSVTDENNFNILSAFKLIYKSIQTESVSDIYNVYISDRVFYYNTLTLSFFTEIGLLVQTRLFDAEITVNNIQPIINNVSIVEAIKPTLNNVSIRERDLQPIINNVIITPNLDISLHNVSIDTFEYDAILNNVVIGQIEKPIINNVEIEYLYKPVVNNIEIVEAIKPTLNNVSIVEVFKPSINVVSIDEAIKPSILDVNITYLKIPVVNSVSIVESIKPVINNISISQIA